MTKKKDTAFDLIGYRCMDLDHSADMVKEFKDNFKKGKFDLKELTEVIRDIRGNSKSIKEELKEIKEGFDKLTKH